MSEVGRNGHFIQTFSGGKFWPLDPRPEEVRIKDIAHALSNICRFGGHVPEFYSVAQHSVLVSEAIEAWGGIKEMQFLALLHDAAEAYLGDVIWPLKRAPHMALHVAMEDQLAEVIYERFRLNVKELGGIGMEMRGANLPRLIEQADTALLLAEARDFFNNPDWGRERLEAEGIDPWPIEQIIPWEPAVAEAEFMRRFEELTL